MNDRRPGEEALPVDPAVMDKDAGLVFIGRVRSPWTDRASCPKNMRAARETGRPASVEVDEPFRAGLFGLEGYSHVVLLTWLDGARRDLVRQKPRHRTEATGTFALRSPVRPNPIGLHVARIVRLDADAGLIEIDAVDVLDATPLLDIKPYYPSIDSFPEAVTARGSNR